MNATDLIPTVQQVPGGAWAVGVSGGLDSVALLCLLRRRRDLHLHVVHLNHQLRGAESDADAAFVHELARRLGVDCTLAQRQALEAAMASLPANPSACYRGLRLALFRQVVDSHRLQGVLLAHHADDQAETVLHRLLRGGDWRGLAGMQVNAELNGMRVLRPLLHIRKESLRQFLQARGQQWREDASNRSERYLRNRLRGLLAEQPALVDALLDVADACASLRDWVDRSSPPLDEVFSAAQLADLPGILALASARRWLTARGVPPDQMNQAVAERLMNMARDAATPARQHFPGPVPVSRRRGRMGVDPPGQASR